MQRTFDLSGLHFLAIDREGHVEHCGRIHGQITPTHYLVEMFDLSDHDYPSLTYKSVVLLDALVGLQLYDDMYDMRKAIREIPPQFRQRATP